STGPVLHGRLLATIPSLRATRARASSAFSAPASITPPWANVSQAGPERVTIYFLEGWTDESGMLFDGVPTDCTSRDLVRLPIRIRTCTSTASSPNSLGNGRNGWALTTA